MEIITIYQGEDACTRCHGWKRIDDGDEGVSWKYWAELTPPSNIAVLAGIVAPIPCPRCRGSGKERVVEKERVYDEQIAPLMEQILEICQREQIGTICTFAIGDDFLCTSALLGGDYDTPRAYSLAIAALGSPGK